MPLDTKECATGQHAPFKRRGKAAQHFTDFWLTVTQGRWEAPAVHDPTPVPSTRSTAAGGDVNVETCGLLTSQYSAILDSLHSGSSSFLLLYLLLAIWISGIVIVLYVQSLHVPRQRDDQPVTSIVLTTSMPFTNHTSIHHVCI
ncbi:hypothetical protein KQX54_018107 [Cotesia glomerata]|uniref:Uncharacterized protein n=1 Tax=Cotesia glomerata TaxID=32391 RepID=A0AAV7IET4_COTGL|nr:hypothetical protein KQX54_018107 [Cotesia glomerata]